MDGPIRTVLVANRGEIARRIFRTARAMGIRTAAVYSDPDREAPHAAEADVAVAIGGTSSEESYLDVEKVMRAAALTGADALHPGYGFLSERPELAAACEAAGIRFVGPSATAMSAMALKVEAKEMAAQAGVPVLPSAAVTGDDPAAWRAAVTAVGLPLLVKASAGGGGRGMRVVESEALVVEAVEAARREALSSFGDGTVFLERYVRAPRHIEVQVFADRHGNAVHLFERECSIQRRHQKVVEEAPSPAVGDDLRTRMTGAALALTRAIAYEGAGTVEFLVEGDEFWFLEMNTRLQVEHPVTEAVTGLDLVRLQLEVASGRPLPFGQDDVVVRGHAIEARLYAEDVPAGFLPSAGRLHTFEIDPLPGLRVDAAVESGSEVPPYYDPMIAKVVAHAPTRHEAAAVLARALRGARLHGIPTNRDLLAATLQHDAFLAGETTTAFLPDHPDVVAAAPPERLVRASAVAAAIATTAREREALPTPPSVPAGWQNVAGEPARFSYTAGAAGYEVAVRYRRGGVAVTVEGEPVEVSVVAVSGTAVDLEVDGERRRYTVHAVRDASRTRLFVSSADGQVDLVEAPAGADAAAAGGTDAPVAPVPGTVVAVLVSEGQAVAAGEALVVLEAMKMEHRVVADRDGVVADVRVSPGERVDAHQVLLTFAS